MTPSVETTLPLKQVAQRTSMELEALYGRLERLEHGLDRVFTNSSDALDAKSIAMLQELDMLRQSIGALAAFLAQVAEDTNAEGLVNPDQALGQVTLRDMATRLRGEKENTALAGIAELF